MSTFVEMPDGTVVEVNLGRPSPAQDDTALGRFLRNEVPPELIPRLEAAEEAPLPRVGVPGAFDVRRGAPPPSRPSRTDVIRERARIAGVELRSAPTLAQQYAALVPDDMKPDYAARIMERVTGYEHPTRRGAATGEVEVFDPITESVFFFDKPGVGTEDFEQFVFRDLTAALGEIPVVGTTTAVGGALGGPKGAGIGAVVGGVLGAGTTRFLQLEAGRQMGLHNLTSLEMLAESGLDAAVAGAGAFAPSLPGIVSRRHIRRFLRGLPEGGAGLDVDGLVEALDEAIEMSQELSAQTGRQVSPSVGEVASAEGLPSSEMLHAAETGLRPQASTGLAQQTRELGEAAGERFEQLAEQVPRTGTTTTALGEGVREEALRPLRESEVFARDRLDAARTRLQSQVDEISVSSDRPQFGRDLRLALESEGRRRQAEVNQLYSGPGGVYETADELIGNRTVPAIEARQRAVFQQQTLNESWFGNLDPSRKSTIEKFLVQTEGAGEPRFFVDESGVATYLDPREVSFRDVQNGIRDLRQMLRDHDNGALPDINRKVVADMLAAAEKSRAALLAYDTTGELAVKLDAAESFTRATKDAFDRSFAGKLVQKNARGRYIVDNDKLLETLVAPNAETNMREVSSAILQNLADVDNPSVREAILNAREGVKRGLYQRYIKDVVRKGVPQKDLHAQFMRQFRGGASVWLKPSEMRRLERLGGAQELLDTMNQQNDRLIELALQSPTVRNLVPGLNPDRTSAQTIVRALVQDPDAVQEVVRIARGNPELMERLQDVMFSRLQSRVRSPSTGELNLKALEPYLEAHVGPQGTGPTNADVLREALSPEYVDNLRRLARLASYPGAQPPKPTGRQRNVWSEIAERLFRGRFARPLSGAGYTLTGVLRGVRSRRERFVARVLRDPALMRDLLQTRTVTPTNFERIVSSILANHGVPEAGALLYDMAAGPPPVEIQPPQSATLGGPR